ncbi:MAG: DPP IV N-terminal domain-containing protein [Bacteroidetes bacterium]|nr:DPP IV N-terminal domain-containing protein [Bacteroidota bacterium]
MFSNRVRFLLAIALFNTTFSSAQKKNFTIAEATNGLSTTLALKNIKQPSWQPGTTCFFQVEKDGKNEWLVRLSIPEIKKDTVESLSNLNNRLFAKDSLKGMPSFNWIDSKQVYFNNRNHLVLGVLRDQDMKWKQWLTLPKDASNITVDRSKKVVFTLANNLFLSLSDGTPIQLTNDADKNIINGQAVHRNEFGIDRGIFFSPKGNLIAYYRMNQRMVKDYPIINWSPIPAVADIIKYPMAGDSSHEVTIRVFDPATRHTVELATGAPKDQYLTSVTWSPDERFIYVAVLNRAQNHLWLNQYDAHTGNRLKTLFEEESKTYVEPQHPLQFLPNDNNRFIWWSNKDGYQHLYLYSTQGEQLKELTKGNYDVNEIICFNENEVIITSAKESPLEKHGYAVNLTTGKMRRLDKEAGVHTLLTSENGAFIFDNYTGKAVPRVCKIQSTQTNFSTILLKASNTLAEYNRPSIKDITLKASDGTPLYGKLILPTNFDETKKYPVIVYLYNGPHVQLVRNTFPESGNLWYEYMAQRGYVVFTMDGRGSANRGLKFEQATFHQLGTVEMEDQLKGVDYLKSLPFVDSKRMGVHGWSFGGFMTTSLMLRHPDVFKVGVAGGPVMDWRMYEVMYTERYMGTPQTNSEGYANANLLTKTKELKGKLLVIHGTDDATVVWQHSILFLKNAIDQNVQVDYFVYPGYEHNVRGKDRVHLMQKISDYFDNFLK